MKFLAVLIAALLTISAPAEAAQKKIAVKKIEKIATVPEAELLVANGSSIITIVNINAPKLDIALNAMNISGAAMWSKVIDSGVDEIAMAAARDSAGNLWIAGFSATPSITESATSTVTPENPDSVVVEPAQTPRSDLNRLTIWKVSAMGELSETYFSTENLPGLISAISVTGTGISIVGQYNERSFIQNFSNGGTFGKVSYIGSAKTSLNAIVRNSDGSASVFGHSTETLGGKKLAAKQDGVLIKVSKSGALTNVVRSSAIKAERSWFSADSSFLLSGYVKVGKKVESAVTKFSPTFAPVWTIRVPSTGDSLAITAGKSSVAAINSNASITSLIGWNPTKPSLLLLSFDSKGLITAAKGSSELTAPIALSYSKEIGVVGLAKSSDGSVALYKF
ncbi:hypothetical protein MCEMRE26_01293 [Candidatus Nanopelagicaceae bacterium]